MTLHFPAHGLIIGAVMAIYDIQTESHRMVCHEAYGKLLVRKRAD